MGGFNVLLFKNWDSGFSKKGKGNENKEILFGRDIGKAQTFGIIFITVEKREFKTHGGGIK